MDGQSVQKRTHPVLANAEVQFAEDRTNDPD
jgi:hypothetical protein